MLQASGSRIRCFEGDVFQKKYSWIFTIGTPLQLDIFQDPAHFKLRIH